MLTAKIIVGKDYDACMLGALPSHVNGNFVVHAHQIR